METNNNTYIPPLIVLGVEPREKVTIESFFSEDNNPLRDLLKDPPYLRYSGWNLLTLDWPKIKDGKCWEVKNGDRKTVRLYKDGSLIAIGYADDSFLGWGQDHNKFVEYPQLNSLAVVEYIYEFVELYKKMLTHMPKVKKVRFKVGIKNAGLWEGKKLYLRPKEVHDLFYSFDFDDTTMTAVANDFYENIDIDVSEAIYDSKCVAYRLVSEFFIHFGISPDKIPYTKKDDKGIGYIDTEKIISNK